MKSKYILKGQYHCLMMLFTPRSSLNNVQVFPGRFGGEDLASPAVGGFVPLKSIR